MDDFIIDPEVSSLLPPLTKEERDGLEKQILDDGHVDAGVVGVVEGQRILADGNNRLDICRAHGIAFPTRKKAFKSRADLIQWVIANQFGRRNLTEERKAYYRGKEYLNTKKPVGKPPDNSLKMRELETAENLGKKHNVSRATIERDAKFAEAVDELKPAEKEAVLSGQSGTTKAAIIVGEKPILCSTCQRKGPIHNCTKCAELRAKPHTKSTKPKSAKVGAPIFDDRAITDLIGKLVRLFDERASKLGGKNGPKHRACNDALDKVLAAFTQWQAS